MDTSLVPLPWSAAVTGTGVVPIHPAGAHMLLGVVVSQLVMVCWSAVTVAPFLSLYSVAFSGAGVPSSWCVTAERGWSLSGCASFLRVSGAGMFCCMLLGMSKYVPVAVAVIPMMMRSMVSRVVVARRFVFLGAGFLFSCVIVFFFYFLR